MCKPNPYVDKPLDALRESGMLGASSKLGQRPHQQWGAKAKPPETEGDWAPKQHSRLSDQLEASSKLGKRPHTRWGAAKAQLGRDNKTPA